MPVYHDSGKCAFAVAWPPSPQQSQISACHNCSMHSLQYALSLHALYSQWRAQNQCKRGGSESTHFRCRREGSRRAQDQHRRGGSDICSRASLSSTVSAQSVVLAFTHLLQSSFHLFGSLCCMLRLSHAEAFICCSLFSCSLAV